MLGERGERGGGRIDGRQGREWRRGIDISPLSPYPDVQRAQSALHATLRVKHFAGFADAGRGMGFRLSEGEWKGNVVREDNSIPVNWTTLVENERGGGKMRRPATEGEDYSQ